MNHVDMLAAIDEEGEELTPWEIKFVSDLLDDPRCFMSASTLHKIEQIYEERVP